MNRNLRILPGLHQECLHHISPATRQVSQVKVSGTRKRDHVNTSALDARHNILTILESWSGIVTEKLDLTAPRRSVPHLAHFLEQNLEWFTTQGPAADFADEIEDLAAEVQRIVDPAPDDRRALIGKCVVDDCTGTISTAPQSNGRSGRSSIGCSEGHSWEMHDWIRLRQLVERERKGATA